MGTLQQIKKLAATGRLDIQGDSGWITVTYTDNTSGKMVFQSLMPEEDLDKAVASVTRQLADYWTDYNIRHLWRVQE